MDSSDRACRQHRSGLRVTLQPRQQVARHVVRPAIGTRQGGSALQMAERRVGLALLLKQLAEIHQGQRRIRIEAERFLEAGQRFGQPAKAMMVAGND